VLIAKFGGVLLAVLILVSVFSVTAPPVAAAVTPARAVGSLRLDSDTGITAEQIDEILTLRGSPMAGSGSRWMELGRVHGINPAIVLAMFIKESSAGTTGASVRCRNVGNIVATRKTSQYWDGTRSGRWRKYASWEDGLGDAFLLLSHYKVGLGRETVERVIARWAPRSDGNDVSGYVNTVVSLVNQWSTGNLGGRGGVATATLTRWTKVWRWKVVGGRWHRYYSWERTK
jgi:hypothetical protein